jgi:hypothetical protein
MVCLPLFRGILNSPIGEIKIFSFSIKLREKNRILICPRGD